MNLIIISVILLKNNHKYYTYIIDNLFHAKNVKK